MEGGGKEKSSIVGMKQKKDMQWNKRQVKRL